jgi:glycosyltransferase involved in cell wall biosynthesis
MKKVLIVNNNLDMGGIQKSLINLLKEMHSECDIALLLFSRSGPLLNEVPTDVTIITPRKIYSILGLSKEELKKHPFLFCVKALLIKYTALFSRRSAMKVLGVFQKKISGYDVVISYSHLPSHKYFANGCGDFVLDQTICKKKICLIHCDYLHSGYMSEENNREYSEFDEIACCSDSVKRRFIQGSGINSDKTYTLRNFIDLGVAKLSENNPYCYDDRFINLVSIARLSYEKGIDRAIEALQNSKRSDIRYYIVGSGPQKDILKDMVSTHKMETQVFFVGEQLNPYRYMANADYLLVPSLHEAAPMVFDEANALGLPVITTNTTSAAEIVGENGIICNNSVDGLEFALSVLTKRNKRNCIIYTNQLQKQQFLELLE